MAWESHNCGEASSCRAGGYRGNKTVPSHGRTAQAAPLARNTVQRAGDQSFGPTGKYGRTRCNLPLALCVRRHASRHLKRIEPAVQHAHVLFVVPVGDMRPDVACPAGLLLERGTGQQHGTQPPSDLRVRSCGEAVSGMSWARGTEVTPASGAHSGTGVLSSISWWQPNS